MNYSAMCIDFHDKFTDLIVDQSQFSQKTFGTDEQRGPIGPLKHLAKEVQEAIEDPTDIREYADMMLLLLDAMRRANIKMVPLLNECKKKLQINKERTWPKFDETLAAEPIFCRKHIEYVMVTTIYDKLGLPHESRYNCESKEYAEKCIADWIERRSTQPYKWRVQLIEMKTEVDKCSS